jgi:hypothetical protein
MSAVAPLTGLPAERVRLDPKSRDKDAAGPIELLASQIDDLRAELSRMEAEDFKKSRMGMPIGASPPRPILQDKERSDRRRKLRERENQLLAELNDYLAQEGGGRYY